LRHAVRVVAFSNGALNSSFARNDLHENIAMNFFLTIVLDGLIQASWLFIVALGLTLVFGVLKILNIAHGSFYALGAYIAATTVTTVAAHSLPPSVGFAAMLVSVALIASAVGFLLERGLLKMFYGRDEVVLLLVTYAVFLILEDITKLIWGVNPSHRLRGLVRPQSHHHRQDRAGRDPQ
jgi:branched-subunit amino acid ABC-type transport system permease component